MGNNIDEYLRKFGDIGQLNRLVLLNEMDKIWSDFNLDNKKPQRSQHDAIGKFYSHPVWILNGIFSELDDVSKKHRVAIAEHIRNLTPNRVADYGGGSGVLARCISTVAPALVDIIEPYPSQYFLDRLKNFSNINLVPVLVPEYDIVVAQDVLEHVDDPVGLAVELISATKMNGHLIFANCFYPDIKCHLPSAFYLRHTFSTLMTYAGLKFIEYINGAEHALVFKRIGPIMNKELYTANKRAKVFGSLLNLIHGIGGQVKRKLKVIL